VFWNCKKYPSIFLSLPQRQHKTQIIRKLKSANNLLMLIIQYMYIDQPVNNVFTWCWFLIFLHTFTLRKQSSKFVRVCFNHVITELKIKPTSKKTNKRTAVVSSTVPRVVNVTSGVCSPFSSMVCGIWTVFCIKN